MAESEARAFDPVIIEDVLLSLDGVDYAEALDSVILAPTTAKTKFKAVNGKKKSRVAKPDWVLTLNHGQSFDRASLTAQLITRHGESVPFILTPQSGSLAKIEGSVTLEAVQVGGAAEAVATSGVSLDVDAQPKFTWNGEPAGDAVTLEK